MAEGGLTVWEEEEEKEEDVIEGRLQVMSCLSVAPSLCVAPTA